MRIESVLFPTDFSDASLAALPYVQGIANQFDAEVHVLHVQENVLSPADFAWGGAEDLRARFEQRTCESLEALADKIDVDPTHVHTAVDKGPPYKVIADYAQEHGIGLIVMATHGRTGLPHILMGSTTERVVRVAECPVMTVHCDPATIVPAGWSEEASGASVAHH